jgi:nucleotide-binding universal stress UspA family protein
MKNVLVPIDFSSATAHVLDVVRQLATAFGAKVHIVHVHQILPTLPTTPLGYGTIGVPDVMPMPTEEALSAVPNEEEIRRLEAQKTEIAGAGLEVSAHHATGDVVDEILGRADAIHADVIVMGRHGHSAMYNLLVGSVTEGVLKRARCPVLLVPAK